MKISGNNSIEQNLSSLKESGQGSSIPPILMIALGIIFPLTFGAVSVWSIRKIRASHALTEEQKEQARMDRCSYLVRNKWPFSNEDVESEPDRTTEERIAFCVGGIFGLIACYFIVQSLSYLGDLPMNISNLDEALYNESNRTNSSKILKSLNLPQCYLNETPVVKVIKLPEAELLKKGAELKENLSGLNSAQSTDTLNPQFSFREYFSSFSQDFPPIGLPSMSNFQENGKPYLDLMSVKVSKVIENGVSVHQWARKILCDVFAIENC